MFAVALGAAMWLVSAAMAETADKPAPESDPPVKCLEAVVNPVTGFAFCTNPRGAPVEPPPRASLQRPCKPRAHDADDWMVYEHWSGCAD
jgi:hypothetical protein